MKNDLTYNSIELIMNRPEKPPYYHGTSESSANSLIKNGIIKSLLQSRDRGFFGDGFYVCKDPDTAMNHATTVSSNSPTILEITLDGSPNILYAGETIDSGSVSPNKKPTWHNDFIEWSLNSVEDAAVWEYATDKSKNEIIENARNERTPGNPDFNRLDWYQEVTEYGKTMNYDIIYWTSSEIIINSNSSDMINFNLYSSD